MGVKTLWSLLECCSEQVSDEHLRGASMAVDLAGWVVQNSQCQGMAGHVSRPHLRNLFFRASALLSLGARPVFVLDGAASELKRQTLAARKQQQTQSQQQGTQSQSQAASAEVKSLSRSRLRALMGECRFLLEAMGLPCVQARCEAEALCAQLNLAGLVDAVVTEDSDALCHGATVMLRGFSVQSGGVAAERYRLERLRSSLGVTRERAVAAAILLGCDYFPTGVPGVGREAVLQLMTGWHRDWDALEILRHWRAQEFAPQEDDGRTCPVCSLGDGVHHCQKCKDFTDRVSVPETKGQRDCRCVILSENKKLLKTEASVKKKCLSLGLDWWDLEFPQVVSEFYTSEEIPKDFERKFKRSGRPNAASCVSILTKKLAWTEEYAQQKVIPLISTWQSQSDATATQSDPVAVPVKVVKKRTAGGVASLQLEWRVVEAAAAAKLPPTFESVVPLATVEKAYPDILAEFMETQKKTKTTTTRRKKKKEAEEDALSSQQQRPITSFFPERRRPLASRDVNVCKRRQSPSSGKVPQEKPDVKEKEDVSPCKLSDSGASDDCDDEEELSFLVDEILGKTKNSSAGARKKAIASGLKRPKESEFVTSTPEAASGRAKPKILHKEIVARKFDVLKENNLPKGPGVVVKEVCDIPDDFEDSFDRMCL